MSKKLFYENPQLTECVSAVKEVTETGIIFHETVAFPEGGGQIGDRGILENLLTGEQINFLDCQKYGGRKSPIEEFSNIIFEADVVHHIEEENLNRFSLGEEWKILIDAERRAKISANHTGAHLLYLAVDQVREGYRNNQAGARITEEYGRMDFSTTEKFSSEEINAIEELINGMINGELEVMTFPHEEEREALYWSCDGNIVPCGGTHVPNTNFLKSVSIKRKSIGKDADRLIATFEHNIEKLETLK